MGQVFIGILPIFQPIQRMMPQPILNSAIPTPGRLESKRGLSPLTCFHETKGAGSWLVGALKLGCSIKHWKFGICDTESDTNMSNIGTEQAVKTVNLGIWRVKWPKNRTCWHQTCPHKTICGKQRNSVHDNFECGSTPFLSTKTCRSQKSACLRKPYNKPVHWSPSFEVNLSQLNISPSSTFFLRPGGWSQIVELMLRNLWLQNNGLLRAGRLHQNPDLVCQTFLPVWHNWLWGLSWTWAYHFHVCLFKLPERWCIRGWWGWWVGDVCDKCPMQTSWLILTVSVSELALNDYNGRFQKTVLFLPCARYFSRECLLNLSSTFLQFL